MGSIQGFKGHEALGIHDYWRQAMTDSDLLHWFTYHAPGYGQAEKYEAIRAAGLVMARVVIQNTPPGADQTAAVRKVREAVYTANAAIACGG